VFLARAAVDGADLDSAHQLGAEALTLRVPGGEGVASPLEVLANVALGRGERERGSLLLGAARARQRTGGARRGGTAWGVDAAALERGTALTTEEAVALALHGVLPQLQPPAAESPLTRRELEVAELLGQGLPNREVARALGIRPRTAQGHVENILRKLGFSSRAQVAAWVAERRARGRQAGAD
jgi:non-specific serine/threonine protein kinase